MKTIGLTDEQYQKLLEVLELTQDEGPHGEGWKSDELCAVIEAVRAADQECDDA